MSGLVLASSSPRRKAILEQLGLEFDVMVSDIAEDLDYTISPEEMAKSLAYQKAYDIAKKITGDKLVLGSDTIVVLDNEILGKPKDDEDVFKMLQKLSGRTHRVITGVCLYNLGDASSLTESDTSHIKLREISDNEIKGYIASGEPFGKAGSYAIQGLGGIFVEKIEGSYSGIVGLPVFLVDKMLKHYGIEILGKQK